MSLARSGRLTEDGCTSESPASSIRGRTYESGQEAGPGILMERYVPVTTKERLLFPLCVVHKEPRAAERAPIESFLGVVIQPLLVRRTVCFRHDVLGLVLLEALLEDLCKDLRLADILAILPHCMENVTEDGDEMLLMCFLHVA
jgi:hypothetical protein